MVIKFKLESEKNEVVTYSKVANVERVTSYTHLLLLKIHLSKHFNIVSNWTCPFVACAIAYKQKE
jgi:hypothetical protein